MNLKQFATYLVGVLVFVNRAERRSERGLSQSAENAILLAGAVTIATLVIAVIKVYVSSHLPR